VTFVFKGTTPFATNNDSSSLTEMKCLDGDSFVFFKLKHSLLWDASELGPELPAHSILVVWALFIALVDWQIRLPWNYHKRF
jgi:hypothetical protein